MTKKRRLTPDGNSDKVTCCAGSIPPRVKSKCRAKAVVYGTYQLVVRPDDLWVMLLSTVRYTLGRRSYATAQCRDLVLAYGGGLLPPQRDQIRHEIQDALLEAAKQGRTLGDKVDNDVWRNLVYDLEKWDVSRNG
jgi:hypothetical protein